jgi:hypothetical protein
MDSFDLDISLSVSDLNSDWNDVSWHNDAVPSLVNQEDCEVVEDE